MVPGFAEHFDEVHAITCRTVRAFPEDRIWYRPTSEMLSVSDLVFKMFSQEKVLLIGCRTGRLTEEHFLLIESDTIEIQSLGDLVGYGERVHHDTNLWVKSVSPQELRKSVATFFGTSTPEKLLLMALEHLVYYRGQLWTYLKMLGIRPDGIVDDRRPLDGQAFT